MFKESPQERRLKSVSISFWTASNSRSSIYLSIWANFPMMHFDTSIPSQLQAPEPTGVVLHFFPACRPQHTWFFKNYLKCELLRFKKKIEFSSFASVHLRWAPKLFICGFFFFFCTPPSIWKRCGRKCADWEQKNSLFHTLCSNILCRNMLVFLNTEPPEGSKVTGIQRWLFLSSLLARRDIFQIL